MCGSAHVSTFRRFWWLYQDVNADQIKQVAFSFVSRSSKRMKKVVDVPDLNVTRGDKMWQDLTRVRGSGNAKSMQHPNWPCWEHRIMLICARCSSVAACHQTSRRQQNGKNEKKTSQTKRHERRQMKTNHMHSAEAAGIKTPLSGLRASYCESSLATAGIELFHGKLGS